MLCQWATDKNISSYAAKEGIGTKAAWAVKRHGLRLLPELYEHLNPMPYEAAAQMEKELVEDLRRAGYTITGGH